MHADSQQVILDFIKPHLGLIKKSIRSCLQSANQRDDKTKTLTRTELLIVLQINQIRAIDAIKINSTVVQLRCTIDIVSIDSHFTERVIAVESLKTST